MVLPPFSCLSPPGIHMATFFLHGHVFPQISFLSHMTDQSELTMQLQESNGYLRVRKKCAIPLSWTSRFSFWAKDQASLLLTKSLKEQTMTCQDKQKVIATCLFQALYLHVQVINYCKSLKSQISIFKEGGQSTIQCILCVSSLLGQLRPVSVLL